MLGRNLRATLSDEHGLFDEPWISLPSTKVKRPRREDPFAWCYTYTGFSLAFARAALCQLGICPGSTVIDPFAGSGTTLVAAALGGSAALGVDVSPFSALLSRTRFANSLDPEAVLAYLNAKPKRSHKASEPSDLQLLSAHDEVYAAAVISKISNSVGMSAQELWTELLADEKGRYDTEAAVILSLSLGARDCARVTRGSNPIWYRKIFDHQNEQAGELKALASSWAASISRDLVCSTLVDRNGTRIINADFTSLKLKGSFDFCLTSPPYLNRLDYVVAHLPELSILRHIAPFDVERLRSSMIGTTKIVSKDDSPIPEEWGPTCGATLERIWNHEGYASRTYYYHTYRQYFAGFFNSLKKLTKVLRKRACGIIVIQNSYYKDVNVPTPIIAAEMLQALSWQSQVVRTEAVKVHMGRMSPRQSAYAPRKTLGEAIVHFFR